MSRFPRAGMVLTFALVAVACNNGNDNNNAASNQLPAFDNTVLSIALAADGSGDVYVGGDFIAYNGGKAIRAVRLNADGTIDPAFVTGSGFDGSVRSVAPSPAGDVFVGGDFITYNGVTENRITRLNSNGSLVPGFAAGTGFNNTVHSIALAGDSSGDVFVGGAFTNYNGIPANLIRLKADGTVAPGFVTGAVPNTTVFTVVPAGDGSGDMYVGGSFTSYNGFPANNLVRIKANGSVNPAFVTGTGFNNTVHTITSTSNGDVYVGGAFSSYNGVVANGLVRLKADGGIDLSLATGTGFNNTVFTVALAGGSSDDLYVGGAFTDYNGTKANDLVRLNSNGTIDLTFASGTGFSDTVFRVVPMADGSGDVLVGGQFTTYQSTPVGRFVRLRPTGALVRSAITP